MIAAGSLDRRLVLETPVETDDGAGGVTRSYQTVATLWAQVTPVRAWGDGPNWECGHWLNGRLGGAPLDALVETILADCGIASADSASLNDVLDGYLIDRPMPPRATIDPLALTYAFDASEQGGLLRFIPRGGEPVAEFDEEALVLPENSAPLELTRAQETELPREVSIGYTELDGDYRRAAISSRRLVGGSARASHADVPAVTYDAAATRRADIWLQDLWAGRERAAFALPPSALRLGVGDVIALTSGGRRRLLELADITDTESRAVNARSIDPDIFDLALPAARRRAPKIPVSVGPVHALALDVPALEGTDPPALPLQHSK